MTAAASSRRPRSSATISRSASRRLARSVAQLELAAYRLDAPADVANVIRERPLREREEHAEGGGQHGCDADLAGDRRVAADDREAAPGEPEPEVGVKATAEELEVVGEHEKGADGHEEGDPGLERDRAGDPDGARSGDRDGCEPHEHRARDARAQRPPPKLVQGVGADPDREPESGDRGAKPPPGHDRGEAAADHHVREVPGRVRRMQQRHVVAPAAGLERVPGRSRGRRAHLRDPHMTTPPPRLRRRTSTSTMPAARQSSSWRSSGYACQ